MELECTSEQVKREVLNNVNSTTNKKHCSTLSTFASERC